MNVTVPLVAAMLPFLVLVYSAGFVGGRLTKDDLDMLMFAAIIGCAALVIAGGFLAGMTAQ